VRFRLTRFRLFAPKLLTPGVDVEIGGVLAADFEDAALIAERDFGSLADDGRLEIACRGCGCSDSRACDPPCHWVEEDLCSRCAA
jgi:hypothetical protein